MTRGFGVVFLPLGLFCTALLVSIVLFIDGSSSNSLDQVGKITTSQREPEHGVRFPNRTKEVNWAPWHGGKISDDNILYKKLTLNQTARLGCPKWLQNAPNSGAFEEELLLLYEKFIPTMGYNTIIDCIVKKGIKFETEQMHALGIVLGKYGMRHDIPPQHMIEVNQRYLINLAPMHGVVWSLIQGHENDTVPFAHSLCDFQDSEFVGGVWISCVHGIGHAFGERFGYEGRDKAIELCSQLDQNDLNWAYSCATGVSMKISGSLAIRGTCAEMQYPASCFRFLPKSFYDNEAPCQNITDEYHIRGCVWGHGFASGTTTEKAFREAHIACESYKESDYYHICLDGFFHNIGWYSNEEEKEYCATTIQGELAQESCFYYQKMRRRDFNAKETPWFRPEILEIN